MSEVAQRQGSGLQRGEPSRTAMMSAVLRELHRQEDLPPWVLDDQYALPLVGPPWLELRAALKQVFREPVLRQMTLLIAMRARCAEDRLSAGSFRQYVVLGAGLDSFAWRRPDVLRSVRMFEVDHPATQQWKQERVDALSLPRSDRHVFAPIDFEETTLREGLAAVGFDWAQPALFAWQGVTPYLPLAAVEATLRDVAMGAPGSEIVMGYVPTQPFLDEIGVEFSEVMTRLAAQSGEPLETFLTPSEAEDLVRRCGLSVVENLAREELHGRYLDGRSDELIVLKFERFLTARVG